MVASIAVSWFVGLIFLFILLLYTQDISSIEQTQLQMPIAQLFLVSGREECCKYNAFVYSFQGVLGCCGITLDCRTTGCPSGVTIFYWLHHCHRRF